MDNYTVGEDAFGFQVSPLDTPSESDIRIVNLELLNTDWYVKQLRDFEPKVPMHISDTELKQLGFIPWKKRM